MGSRPPRPPKVAPWASENPKYYPAVDTAAAIGAWTVGIQLPLSDADALTMGFGGRRRPDQVPIGVLNQAFSGFRRKSRTMSAKEKAKHFRGAIMRAFIAKRYCGHPDVGAAGLPDRSQLNSNCPVYS